MEPVSGFSSVSCRETWRVLVPRTRDRLNRIEPRSPSSRPGVVPEGLSYALPMAALVGHIGGGFSALCASAPRTPPYRLRCRPRLECSPRSFRITTPAARSKTGRSAVSSRVPFRWQGCRHSVAPQLTRLPDPRARPRRDSSPFPTPSLRTRPAAESRPPPRFPCVPLMAPGRAALSSPHVVRRLLVASGAP